MVYSMKRNPNGESLDALYRSILTLKDEDECAAYFEDLCTIAEIKALAQRLEVAKMLKDGKTYTEVEAQTGASSATISRVNRCLENGAGGYVTVLGRLEENV
ncbi:MAG: hypothetical protein DBX47_06615 [Clostridiales bacterium]|nr:MAG: hypothetical protein DBX47_06615 [Clostridiales bacterium]